jgi:hypothetical protein
MFGKYFYNKNIRNIVVLFGTIFNDITIKRIKADGTVDKQFKVPIAYGPTEKYMAMVEQRLSEPDVLSTTSGVDIQGKEAIGITLPRMSFEISAINYDPTRKLQSTKKYKIPKSLGTVESVTLTNGGTGYTSAPTVTFLGGGATTEATATATILDGVVNGITNITTGIGYVTTPIIKITGGGGYNATATANLDASTTRITSSYTPTPYNFDIDLGIMVKNSDDGTQILEQILPFFTPEFQVTMNEMSTLGIKRDIPIVFNGLTTEDSYEGDFTTRRALIHTLTFTVQGHIYGYTGEQGIIREVNVNTGTNFINADDVNFNVQPNPLTADPDDDFGYTTNIT